MTKKYSVSNCDEITNAMHLVTYLKGLLSIMEFAYGNVTNRDTDLLNILKETSDVAKKISNHIDQDIHTAYNKIFGNYD